MPAGWEMFLERPLTGWGFNQMPAELPRYVSGYKEKVLYPHNTYLELLVEHGVVGLALYLWLMWEMWRLRRGAIPAEEKDGFLDRDFHRLWPILLAVYWVNAAMVVMSYQFVNGLLFTHGGDAGGAAAAGGGFAIMLTVAYLANQFPSPVEPYVGEEIEELRRRGVRVVTGSVRKTRSEASKRVRLRLCCSRLSAIVLLRAAWLCLRRWKRISPRDVRVIFRGREGPLQRVKALLHTWLGACYAVLLESRGVEHIHVHHGYFGSWIAMVAARLLDVGFSMTLHGSDLLLHGSYLDVKLENCAFCLTVSEYNRRYILEHYPGVDAEKLVVSRLGVEASAVTFSRPKPPGPDSRCWPWGGCMR